MVGGLLLSNSLSLVFRSTGVLYSFFPRNCFNDINSLLSAFLWKGEEFKCVGAKVKWTSVCSPKREGGLGFKLTREPQCLGTCGLLLAKCGFIHTYIKHYCFWYMPCPPDASWTLWRLFKLRGIGQDLMKWVVTLVGNGQSVILWLDHWHPLGPLYEKFRERVVYNLCRSLSAKEESMKHQGEWKWPRQRNAVSREIQAHTPPSLLPNSHREDKLIWIPSATGTYSTSSAWNAIRVRNPEVPRFHVVWYIPQWSFIQWLAFQGRLATKDRLLTWGVVSSDVCIICNSGGESRSHLFFECPVSCWIWLYGSIS